MYMKQDPSDPTRWHLVSETEVDETYEEETQSASTSEQHVDTPQQPPVTYTFGH